MDNKSESFEISRRTWLIACISILLLGAALRLYALELKPMHHDEGVNGFFLTNLVRQGVYKYDPSNYHGPTLYYLALPLVSLFGLDIFAVRLLTVLAGLATILLVFDLRRYIGTLATLVAATLLAVSPGAVYYSRYFIHEFLFVLFTLGLVVATLRFYETAHAGYLVLAATSAALLFATKETAFVSVVTILLAWLVARWWTSDKFILEKLGHSIFLFPVPAARIRRTKQRTKQRTRQIRPAVDLQSLTAKFGGRDRLVLLASAAVGSFLLINILFYSSFLTNWPGVKAAVDALQVWTKTGTSEFHGKSFDTYFSWLFQEEMPIFVLAVVGSFVALFGRKVSRFAIFVGAWAFGLLLAYSLIPYKTPWLMLSFIVPMAIVGGYAVEYFCSQSWGKWTAPVPAVAIATIAVSLSVYQTVVLNFREYDNDQYPYVYAHTHRELTSLVSKVEQVANRAGTKELGVAVASPENWPLPWYFRDNSRVAYAGNILEHYDPAQTPVVIGRESKEPTEDQSAKLAATLGSGYEKLGSYTLRPGVRLALFVRRDLAMQ